jgi:hypothetical protein
MGGRIGMADGTWKVPATLVPFHNDQLAAPKLFGTVIYR